MDIPNTLKYSVAGWELQPLTWEALSLIHVNQIIYYFFKKIFIWPISKIQGGHLVFCSYYNTDLKWMYFTMNFWTYNLIGEKTEALGSFHHCNRLLTLQWLINFLFETKCLVNKYPHFTILHEKLFQCRKFTQIRNVERHMQKF